MYIDDLIKEKNNITDFWTIKFKGLTSAGKMEAVDIDVPVAGLDTDYSDDENPMGTDFRSKIYEIVYRGVALPQGAPERFYDRSVLLDELQKAELKFGTKFSRTIKISIPRYYTWDACITELELIISKRITQKGLIAIYEIHNTKRPHIHLTILSGWFENGVGWIIKN